MGHEIELVRWLASIGDLYQSAYLARVDAGRLRNDRSWGTRFFLFKYAFERQGAPRGIRIAAVKLMGLRDEGELQWNEVQTALRQMYSGNMNDSFNPLTDRRLADFDVPHLTRLVEDGNVAEAFTSVTLRGVGPKIATFFLRDLVTILQSESRLLNTPESYLYCQPIDIWVRESLQEMQADPSDMPTLPRIGLDKKDREMAWRAISLALEAGVSPLRLNQGLWYFCANVVADAGRLKSLLAQRDVSELEGELELMKEFLPIGPM